MSVSQSKFKNMWDKFKVYMKKNKTEIQLLEPLSTVIRLCLLSFQVKGTKIAIYNNRIYSQNPNILQGTIRWTYGNKRNELHYLYRPIIIATQQYNTNTIDSLQKIFDFAIRGLNNLKKAYGNHSGILVCHSIDLYKDAIRKKVSEKEIKEITNDELTSKLYSKFKNLWNEEQIKLIAELLTQADKTSDNQIETKAYIKAIDSILQSKETQSLEIIKKFTKNITNKN
tara:strand:+ start:1714 stop:2394 length:681 start_codon:yes stop_codon:yes gene_type:complete